MFDKHIPPPRIAHPKFRDMEVGESVFTPHEGGIMTCKAYQYAVTIQKRSDTYRFMGRSVTENRVKGVRIWRTR